MSTSAPTLTPTPQPGTTATPVVSRLAVTSFTVPPLTLQGIGDVAIGADGAAYFLAGDAQVFRATVTGVSKICAFPDPPVLFFGINGSHTALLAARADGTLFSVASPHQLISCASSGVSTIVSSTPNAGPTYGTTIALDPSGSPVTIDQSSILTFAPNGLAKVAAPTSISSIAEVAGPDGTIWFTDARAMYKVVNGSISATFPLPNNIGLNDIVVGSDGNIWFDGYFIDLYGTPMVGSMTPQGSFSTIPVPIGKLVVRQATLVYSSNLLAIERGPKPNTLLLLDRANGNVVVYTPPSSFVVYGLPQNATINNLRTAPDGKIWYTLLTSANVPSVGYFTLP